MPLADSVVLGFTAGAAVLILSSQLPAAVGLSAAGPEGGVLQRTIVQHDLVVVQATVEPNGVSGNVAAWNEK